MTELARRLASSYFEQVVRGFARYHKYGLGSDLRDGARRVLRLVMRANSRGDKAPVLLEIREEIEELKVLGRLAQDANAFANAGSLLTRGNEGATTDPDHGRSRSAMPEELAAPGVP